jgi:hypothetical protein
MKLWLLTRDTTPDRAPIYDCYDGYVIAAPTEEEARSIASTRPADEGAECWLAPTMVSCTHIGESLDEEPGIFLADFHAG